ncbi:MAG: DNA-3-methyladenine glycosylase [Bacteroidales bacterium]
MIIGKDFYRRSDVVKVARDLVGKVIVANIDGILTSGIITETEAYAGITDKASHAYNNRRTSRTQVMYKEGGIAYIYLCYGIHHLFNFVTDVRDVPHAVLLRGIIPLNGKELMMDRCGKSSSLKPYTDGPGKLTRALGINTSLNGENLVTGRIWVEDIGLKIPDNLIYCGPRVGVDYAEEDACLPYRFLIKDNDLIQKSLPF